MSIFVLTRITTGPAGHGEPGMQSHSIAADGNGYVLGKPYPAFTNRQAAIQFAVDNDLFGYEPKELELI